MKMIRIWREYRVWVAAMLMGFFIARTYYSFVEWQFEDEIIDRLTGVVEKNTVGFSDDSKIEYAVVMAKYLMERRTTTLSDIELKSIKAWHSSSSLIAFYTGKGACGYYSMFAARLLKNLGYRPKIVRQLVNGTWGGHITLVLKDGERLKLVDPLFGFVFKNDDSSIADIREVQRNFGAYTHQLPEGYNLDYRYEDFDFTNWNKWGGVLKPIHWLFDWLGDAALEEKPSMRMWFIDAYWWQIWLSFIFALLFGYFAHRWKVKS